jgi:hypothetical protein
MSESMCEQCNEFNYPMGRLGMTNHYSCRYCGFWWSEKVSIDEVLDEMEFIDGPR